jgi:hypothetical protein
MPRHIHSARQPLTFVKTRSVRQADFSDRESQRVLTAAARAVARELGREAACEFFAELIGHPKGRPT